MQTMLHLQPRLRSIQDQRRARSVEGPDLTQITQFVNLSAGTTVDAAGRVPLQLHKLREDMALPPFYLQQTLQRLDAEQANPQSEGWHVGQAHAIFQGQSVHVSATDAERRGQRLLDATSPVLQSLNRADTLRAAVNGHREATPTPATRADLFRAGLRQGVDIARLLDAHLLAPIRQDDLVPGDPFVQTTLYVVAPLFEPLASALIWPTLVHLLNYLGDRHISQVVAVFATGSYAGDKSRAVEDATSFAALAELEALSNLHPEGAPAVEPVVRAEALTGLSTVAGSLSQWVGKSIFDRIYLVDREKSNQGLVRDSYELSVLVGNALEALITTDGNQYVEEQLGIDLRNAHERPYSLLGAASDYVPLDYVFQAVHQQEEKRLVREVILGSTPAETGQIPSLSDLGITQAQVVAQLVAQMPDLFLDVTPQTLADLAVHPDFILPPPLAAEIRGLGPAEWLDAFDDRLETAGIQFERLVGVNALDQAWGLDGLHANGLPKSLRDKRLLPGAAFAMRRTFVDLLVESPAGLRQAQAYLSAWQSQLEEERRRNLTGHAPGQRALAGTQRQLAIRQWRTRYERNRLIEPSLGQTMFRSALLVAVVVLVAAGYLALYNRPFDPILDGGLLLGVFLGAVVGGAGSYRRRLTQIQKLRRERVTLAQAELTAHLQERVQQGLMRAYDYLAEMLNDMSRALEETTEDLNAWAVAGGMPSPDTYAGTHLRQPQLSDRLWEICRSHLRSKEDQSGRRSEERLRSSWRSVAWRRRLEWLLLEQQGEQPLPAGMQMLLRETVQTTMAELSAVSAQPVRDELVRLLAKECNLEHLLWRDAVSSRHPLLMQIDGGNRQASAQNLIHRFLESLRSHAKPSANYDVADRLASHGIMVDFAAVWGSVESDLNESTLREFRSALLPTDDPFRVTFVRTVHGLFLGDLSSIRRYYLELTLLDDASAEQVSLVKRQRPLLYGIGVQQATDDAAGDSRRRQTTDDAAEDSRRRTTS